MRRKDKWTWIKPRWKRENKRGRKKKNNKRNACCCCLDSDRAMSCHLRASLLFSLRPYLFCWAPSTGAPMAKLSVQHSVTFVFLLRFLCWCLLLVHVPLLVLVPLPLSPLVLVPLRLPLCTSSFTSGVHWWLGAEESLNPIPTVMNKSTIKIPGELYICVLINHEWIDPVP